MLPLIMFSIFAAWFLIGFITIVIQNYIIWKKFKSQDCDFTLYNALDETSFSFFGLIMAIVLIYDVIRGLHEKSKSVTLLKARKK